jgi:hypothetical protein
LSRILGKRTSAIAQISVRILVFGEGLVVEDDQFSHAPFTRLAADTSTPSNFSLLLRRLKAGRDGQSYRSRGGRVAQSNACRGIGTAIRNGSNRFTSYFLLSAFDLRWTDQGAIGAKRI